MTVKSESWRLWINQLSPYARKILSGEVDPFEVVDDKAAAYASLLSSLSPEARTVLEESQVHGTEVEEIEKRSETHRKIYGLVECSTDEYPVLRIFRDPFALSHHLSKLEGQDVTAWAFHGNALPFTKGSPRWLILQDRRTALMISPDGKETKVVGVDEIDQAEDLQEDGYLGPEYMKFPAVDYAPVMPALPSPKKPVDDSDDFNNVSVD